MSGAIPLLTLCVCMTFLGVTINFAMDCVLRPSENGPGGKYLIAPQCYFTCIFSAFFCSHWYTTLIRWFSSSEK
jgi:hypothetical protein